VYDSAGVHVFHGVDHLLEEEPSGVFAHGAHGLAEVKEEAALDVLHHDEDEVVNHASRWLDYLTSVTVVHHADDAEVVKVFQDGDLVVNRKDGVVVSAEELILEDFDGDVLGWVLDVPGQVHLGGVPLAKRLEDLELAVEDWVLFSLLWLHLAFH